MSNNKSKKVEEEVEQLLESARDELKLSHISWVSLSPDYLLPDLDRRFQALKSRSTKLPLQSSTSKSPPPPPPADEDDLFARFAALKAPSSSSSAAAVVDPIPSDEDEVDKIIRWAKDAARLDPSPPSDYSDTTDSEDDDMDQRKH